MISQLHALDPSIPPPPSRSSIKHPASTVPVGLLPSLPAWPPWLPAHLILDSSSCASSFVARHPKRAPLPSDASAALEHCPPREIERARFSSTPTPLRHVACETEGPGPQA